MGRLAELLNGRTFKKPNDYAVKYRLRTLTLSFPPGRSKGTPGNKFAVTTEISIVGRPDWRESRVLSESHSEMNMKYFAKV
jgi:hypothetical protein